MKTDIKKRYSPVSPRRLKTYQPISICLDGEWMEQCPEFAGRELALTDVELEVQYQGKFDFVIREDPFGEYITDVKIRSLELVLRADGEAISTGFLSKEPELYEIITDRVKDDVELYMNECDLEYREEI